MREGRWRVERIAFTDVVARSAHRLNDLIGDPVAADVAEGACQTAGHDGVAAREQHSEYLRSIAHHGKCGAGFRGVSREESSPDGHERCREREETQAVDDRFPPFGWQGSADFQERGIVSEGGYLVARPR